MTVIKTEIIRAADSDLPAGSWPLQGIDQANSEMVIRGTWIFNSSFDPDRIKTGLAKILKYYPLLSGRMDTGKVIQFNNAGVPLNFVDGKDLTASEVQVKRELADQFSLPINTKAMKQGKAAVMSVQLTELKDGWILGVRCAHACFDGVSFYTMISNWGRICRGEEIESPLLDQDLMSVKSKRSKEDVLKDAQKRGWIKPSLLALFKFLPHLFSGNFHKRSRGFYFSKKALKELKQKAASPESERCSTNEALSAYLIKMLIRLFGHSDDTSCQLVTVVDGRDRLPKVPFSFTGNGALLVTSPEFSAGAELGQLARTLRESLAPYIKRPSSELPRIFTLMGELMQHKIFLFPNDPARVYTRKPTSFYFNNFSRLPIYDVDFGFGKPVCVIPHNLPDPVVIWPAHPSKGGVEVYFTGFPAMAIEKLVPGDSWLKEMGRFEE